MKNIKKFQITVASLEIKTNGSYATYTVFAPSYAIAVKHIPHKEFCVKEYFEFYN